MNVTIRQLYAFRAVSDVGSFTGAARRLGIAQSALSRSIQDLEAELGTRLFDRTTRSIELTIIGREFLAAVDKLIIDLDTAIQGTRELLDRKRGRLTVAAPPLLAGTIIPSVIANYKKRFPAIDVSIIDAQTDVVIARVRSGEADCGIGTFAEEEGLKKELLFEDELMVWCSGRSHLVHKPNLTWNDVLAESLIAMTRDSQIRRLIDQTALSLGKCVRPAYEVSHMTTAVTLVDAGLGVAVLPAYVSKVVGGINVVPRPLCDPVVRRDVSVLRSSLKLLSPAAESFVQTIRKQAVHLLRREETLSVPDRVGINSIFS
jgi:DNA-binding transcriptional LysR family regulator